jgi:hypothetical protein
MPGWTNRGKFRNLGVYYRGVTPPTNFYIALVTSAVAPNPDTNTFGELTQIAAGNGYTSGGIQLARNSTDFDVLTEDDVNDRALVQLKDIVWTATGGNIPASGAGARYAILTDDNAVLANREVINYWDLGADRVVSDTQQLKLIDCELRINES